MNIKKLLFRVAAAALATVTVTAVVSCTKKQTSSTVITTSPLPECELIKTEKSGDFTIAVYEEYAEIKGYSGSATAVTVPSEYDGAVVRSIGKSAFKGNRKIETVKLPESVVNIADSAFELCENLAAIEMPSVKSIGASSFKNSGLRSVVLPRVLQNLGRYSFSGSKLEYIELPGCIVRSGDYVFSGCESLKSVSFEEGVPEISTRMFSGCTALTEVVLPKSVTTLGEYAFAYCTSLTKVTVPEKTVVQDGAFYGSSDVIIRSAEGSSAQDYAERYKFTFEIAE